MSIILSEFSSEVYSTTPQTITTFIPKNASKILHGNNTAHAFPFYIGNLKLYYSIGSTFSGSLISFLGIIACLHFGLKIAKNMHKDMINNLLNGSMSFFDTHLIGTILTRFSRDLNILDERMPVFWNGLRVSATMK